MRMSRLGVGPILAAGAALVPMSKAEGGGSTTATKTIFGVMQIPE